MSTPMDNGGPAFPQALSFGLDGTAHCIGEYFDATGMTLRDWFAGQALAGSLASQCAESHWAFAALPNDQNNDQKAQSGISKLCYQLADAMLAARKEPA